jgi:multiple sugar transport system permease protein
MYLKTFHMFDIGGGTAIAVSSFIFLTLLIWLYFRLFPVEEND